MLQLPSPLHPALVHFPIVLILLGAAVACVAVFTARWHVRWIAAILLTLGALGAWAAVSSGKADGESVEGTPAVEPLVEEHEEWAERTQTLAVVGALLAAVAVGTLRWPAASRSLAAACALAAVAASYCVYETGHRGGKLVYRHGAGVNLAPSGALGTAPAAPVHKQDDDD